jgi:fibronectin type 3 domain-containing protein
VLDINGYFASQSSGVIPPAQPHTVQLSWYASISPDVIGYNLYRGNVSGGPYTLINAGVLPQTSYQDSDVMAGQTYYYVTTAVDSSNVESGFSNEALAMVPTS